jgi:hypothetical protein
VNRPREGDEAADQSEGSRLIDACHVTQYTAV